MRAILYLPTVEEKELAIQMGFNVEPIGCFEKITCDQGEDEKTVDFFEIRTYLRPARIAAIIGQHPKIHEIIARHKGAKP